jgi:hypothetical protein
MDMALFKTWRDERLQDKTNKEDAKKMQVAEANFSEHEGPKKREVDEAALFSILVPSSAQEVNPAAEIFEKVPHHVLQIYSKPRTVSPEGEEDDVVPPMYDSAYYTISGYVVADTTKTKFLFLFLPRKEKIRDAIGVQYWWSVLCLKESGWGPPSSVLKLVVHKQKSPFYFSFVYFSFWFRKQLSELLSLFYFYIFVLLVSQVIGRSATTIKPKGCAPM